MLRIDFLVVLLSSYFAFSKCECDLKKFEDADIVPNILREVPKQTLEIKYLNRNVNCGEHLSFETTEKQPDVKYNAADNEIYTLFFIDPDAPYPDEPKLAQFLHWFIIDIPGSNVTDGRELMSYYRPDPPPDSPEHRYIMIVTQQPGYLMDYSYPEPRTNFNMSKTMEELGLKEITAGNFFYLKKAPAGKI